MPRRKPCTDVARPGCICRNLLEWSTNHPDSSRNVTAAFEAGSVVTAYAHLRRIESREHRSQLHLVKR